MVYNIQKILGWIAEANDDELDALYDLLINQQLYNLDDIVGKDVYLKWVKDIKAKEIECHLCGCDLDKEFIYCDECLGNDDK